jgi:D-3-phosphoglycerate dehydrogenase
MSKKFSLKPDKIKILLLENIHPKGVDWLKDNGYNNIAYLKNSLEKNELIKAIQDVHIIGIRSRTKITKEVLNYANKLIAIGCFSVGADQVDLLEAKLKGIPVFNAPYSNTRSVAELVLAEIICLLRRLPEKNKAAHEGLWLKDAKNCYEARGKTLGIVGYGHIGSQVSILAEDLGMKVIYYDIEKKLSLGNAKPVSSLKELLQLSDIVTLHVPETELTVNMITKKELTLMKTGAYLINASRGKVVNLNDLKEFLDNGKLFGAALDVFPNEPTGKDEKFLCPLQNYSNVILTPHIGGSTEEAQENIALEVVDKLLNYSNVGSTIGATNFVEISLPKNVDKQRYLHIHKNKPGVINKISKVFTKRKINIAAQYLQTDPYIGYVIIDIDFSENPKELIEDLKNIPGTIKVRMLY